MRLVWAQTQDLPSLSWRPGKRHRRDSSNATPTIALEAVGGFIEFSFLLLVCYRTLARRAWLDIAVEPCRTPDASLLARTSQRNHLSASRDPRTHNADAPRPPPINTTESNRASPRRDATATNNSKATYQSQDSQDSEPDTPLLPGCSVMAPPPKPDGAASPAKLAIGVVGIFGARPVSFL